MSKRPLKEIIFKINFVSPSSLLSPFSSVWPIEVSSTSISQYLRISPDFSIQSINKFCSCFLENLSWLLTASYHLHSATLVQATSIPHLNCHSSFLLSTLYPHWSISTRQPEFCCKPVFSYNVKNKTKVHTKTLHDQTPATSQTSSFNTLPRVHFIRATVAFLIFLHHVKMCLPAGPLGLVFLLPRTLFLQCFLISFRSLLKCHFLRKLPWLPYLQGHPCHSLSSYPVWVFLGALITNWIIVHPLNILIFLLALVII